jgi:YidC/Oxa1 family membrane protein insertase
VSRSITHALPYLLLIALVAISGVIQQRQIQGRQSANPSSPVNSQQQMIMKIMPFFLPIFSFGMPAALVVYFVVSNVWRIGQQAFITRTLYAHAGDAPPPPIDVREVPSEPKPSAPKARAKDTPARSPMGRNRRSESGSGGDTRAAKPKPAKPPTRKPTRKPENAPAPRPSGRVTPPGSSARSRKKKRT